MNLLEQRNYVFSREDTKAVKGIIVVVMLFHHLAGFPDRFPVGFPGFSSLWANFVDGGFLERFALSAKLCVPLYFFLGGYGLYMRWRSSNFSVTTTILNIYKAYWRVFLVFVPIAILFFARSGDGIPSLCTKYVFYRKLDMVTVILSDLIGWTCNLNSEWWFLKSYICLIPLGYLFCTAIKRNRNVWVDFFIALGMDIFIQGFLKSITCLDAFYILGSNLFYDSFLDLNGYTSAFYVGIVFAKYDIISVMKRKIREFLHTEYVGVLVLAVVFWCKGYILDLNADIVYCAIIIPILSLLLDRCDIIKKISMFLGKHSTNMWLIHSFYCYYFLEVTKIVYCTRNVWVDLLILIVLSLVSSIVLDGFYKTIGKLAGKLRRVQGAN